MVAFRCDRVINDWRAEATIWELGKRVL